ncbi:hypothetical protein C2G38_1596241 [Gigaspora rosea]|uniref:Uncharacterized protein n=1 Tax=Gigaspora rosea TaxID=44941 RepID=A0A397UYJ5_9GLOM|nr:hypothetical protein C2G38_1596241 [Gigaspora rosea]
MQTQKGESKDLSEVDSLKLENVRLMTRIAELEQIVKEKNALETELKQIIEENAEKAKLRDAELNARIMELERSAKGNEERFVKLEQKQCNTVDRLENGDNSSEDDVNIPDLVIKSLEDDTSASDITDDALSSDVYQGSKIQCSISSIHTESKSPEDKEIEFLDRVHKERISNVIGERNREKKLRSQGLSSDNNSSEQSNSLYNVKTVTLETNPKNSTEKIPYNQKVERGLRLELFICTKDNNHKKKKVFDIQIPEFSLEEILTGSGKVTSQNIVDLFRVAMKIRQKESLCWYCYYKAYENRVNDVKTANNIDEQ